MEIDSTPTDQRRQHGFYPTNMPIAKIVMHACVCWGFQHYSTYVRNVSSVRFVECGLYWKDELLKINLMKTIIKLEFENISLISLPFVKPDYFVYLMILCYNTCIHFPHFCINHITSYVWKKVDNLKVLIM